MAEDAQRGQRAVAVASGHLSSASSVLRRFASILLAARLSAALLPGGGWRRSLGVGRWGQSRGWPTAAAAAAAIRTIAGRLCALSRRVRVSTFVPASAVVAALEGAVEVDADAVAGDSRVLVGQGEHEGGVVAEADPPLPDAQAALRLAEEHHIWGEREVVVVLQRIAAEELGGLSKAIAARLPGGTDTTAHLRHSWLPAGTFYLAGSLQSFNAQRALKIRMNRLSRLLYWINNFMKALIPVIAFM